MKSQLTIETFDWRTLIIPANSSETKLNPSTVTFSEIIVKDMSYKVALSLNNLTGLSITFHKVKSENSPMNVNDSAVMLSLKHP